MRPALLRWRAHRHTSNAGATAPAATPSRERASAERHDCVLSARSNSFCEQMSSRVAAAVGIACVLVVGVVGAAYLAFRGASKTSSPCRVVADGKSYALDREQATNAGIIAAAAGTVGLPHHAVTIGIAAALQESRLHNLAYGDRDSLGLFQQRPSQGWGSPAQILDPH